MARINGAFSRHPIDDDQRCCADPRCPRATRPQRGTTPHDALPSIAGRTDIGAFAPEPVHPILDP
jgi:hypothetical protein